jgi:hypothetical protein
MMPCGAKECRMPSLQTRLLSCRLKIGVTTRITYLPNILPPRLTPSITTTTWTLPITPSSTTPQVTAQTQMPHLHQAMSVEFCSGFWRSWWLSLSSFLCSSLIGINSGHNDSNVILNLNVFERIPQCLLSGKNSVTRHLPLFLLPQCLRPGHQPPKLPRHLLW